MYNIAEKADYSRKMSALATVELYIYIFIVEKYSYKRKNCNIANAPQDKENFVQQLHKHCTT